MQGYYIEHKQKYEKYRHHAWAGLGLLTVFAAINYLLKLPFEIAITIVGVLSIYIVVALIFTYRYSKGLSADTQAPSTLADKETEKAEKKRIKAELKKKKKEK